MLHHQGMFIQQNSHQHFIFILQYPHPTPTTPQRLPSEQDGGQGGISGETLVRPRPDQLPKFLESCSSQLPLQLQGARSLHKRCIFGRLQLDFYNFLVLILETIIWFVVATLKKRNSLRGEFTINVRLCENGISCRLGVIVVVGFSNIEKTK